MFKSVRANYRGILLFNICLQGFIFSTVGHQWCNIIPDVEKIIFGIGTQIYPILHETCFLAMRFLTASNASPTGLYSPRSILAEDCASIFSNARLSCVSS